MPFGIDKGAQLGRPVKSRVHPRRRLACSCHVLLLLLPLLAGAQLAAPAPREQPLGAQEHHADGSRSHRAAVQRVRMMQKMRAVEWEARTQPLEELLQAYRARHLACMSSKRLPGQYMLNRMANNASGIGNQLPSVITGFVLALLMERCYFVDFPFFNDYFEHELDFSWARHEQRLMAHGHNLTDPANAPMAMPFGYTIIADMWMFTDLKEKHAGSYGVEMVRDLDYSAALIQANPHHRDWVDRYFPTREFFAPLAAYLLRIAPRYEAAIKEFRQRRFGIYTIGMQIRRRKCDNNREDLHCEGRPTIQAYCDVARSIQYSHGLSDEDVKFFLAADEPSTYAEVVAILGADRVIFTNNGIAPESSSLNAVKGDYIAKVHTSADNPGTLESALVDMALMARCNDLVVTLASSYGYVAAAWGGFAPVHMVFGEHRSSQNPFWYRAITSEPCFWQAKNMLKWLDARAVARFKSNPFWMQYTQCHNDWV